jgi:hypothetical protein
MNKNLWILALVILLVSSLACSVFTGGAKVPAVTAAPDSSERAKATQPSSGGKTVEATATTAAEAPSGFDTEFPLPSDVSNFTSLGDDAISFQTTLSLKDVVAFYREAFAEAGYQEREINTVMNDTTFSLVFDGHANGKAIVIQGVNLGGGTSISLRFEDL